MKHMNVKNLLVMTLTHFILMFLLMYAMVDRAGNIFPNLNQLYMAGIMTTPMLIMEILFMKSMYENKKAINITFGLSIAIFITLFIFIRKQTAIGDKEFLRAMIPHHAGALLMCKEASIQNPEIRELCKSILSSQQSEIDLMKRLLNEK